MAPESWIVAVLALVVGAAIGALAHRRRARGEAIARTLVPHRTREVLGALQSGAVVVRRDRRSAFANTAATALGIARPDGALLGSVADLAERAWDTGSVTEEEVEVRRGVLAASATVHVRVTPLGTDLALAVANDNTEQRAAELTRREFAVNVSHELKTPVGALALLAETIEGNAEDTVMVRNFAANIRKETRRLTKLIQEIIEISRIQGGDSVLAHERVELAQVIDEAINDAQMAAVQRDVVVVRDLKASPAVMGDRDLLVMALRNLIDNAVAYSEDGTKVTVSLNQLDDVAHLSVLDQGIGIATADQERVFERFYRTDPARSRATGGTGLGLSIVKHVALQHAGAVDLWSKPGIGSTFTIRLKATEEDV